MRFFTLIIIFLIASSAYASNFNGTWLGPATFESPLVGKAPALRKFQ